VGLVLVLTLYPALGIGLRFFTSRYCAGPRGVLYREAGGLGLLSVPTARTIFQKTEALSQLVAGAAQAMSNVS
jgi:hypothetical protein